MIKYLDLLVANETIKTTDIKGKDYAEVNERIKVFRMLCPNGAIETELLSNNDGMVIMKATIKDEKGNILGTGTAYERENSSFINKTSYIENCETSALGRALGIAGFGIDTSVASAEEVQNAINNQNDDKLELMNKMNKLEVETETNHEDMLQYYGVESNNQMSVAQLKDCIKKLEKKASK